MRVDGSGLISFGHYIPFGRVDLSEFCQQWGVPESLSRMYRLNGRNRVAVAAADEDAITLGAAAALRCLTDAPARSAVSTVLMGSESHPYAVKPSAAVIAEALGLTPAVFAADVEFACKGGTAAMMLSWALSQSGRDGAAALAIGADCPQSAPGSLLEASVGAAAAAFLVGPGTGVIATIDAVTSTTSDLTDFWRRDGARHPSVVGKFSVDEGYMAHSRLTAERLMNQSGLAAEDFAHVVFHQPYATLPATLAKSLGFNAGQLRAGLAAAKIGNSYSAACLLGLCGVLETAAPGERILLVSFGSGAGSDGFVLTATEALLAFRERRAHPGLALELGSDHADWLSYGRFANQQGKLQ